ncbi:MAG TPA: magnesium transporter [bacterium]
MEEADVKTIVEDLEYLASEKDARMVLNILVGNHPADIADLLENVSGENRKYIFGLLDADTASDVIMEMDEAVREDLISELHPKRLSEMVDEMPSDDATDFVAELPKEVAEQVLGSIDPESSDEVKELLRHEEDTAGGIMALEFVAVRETDTVDEAINKIRAKADEVESVYNVYVVDVDGILVGMLPLNKLIVAKSGQIIKNIMEEDVVSVTAEMDQEQVANLFRRYDLVSVPVVDSVGKLIGRITIDDIVDVMQEEASEDIQKMAGLTEEEEIRETSALRISMVRLPWLLVAFVGEMLSAFVLSRFEASLKELFIAAFFIPLMMAMGGNAGMQAATIVVRGLALGELNPDETMKRLFKEVRVSVINGAVCGLLLFGAIAMFGEPQFGMLLGGVMLVVMLNASLVGASIPLALGRFGVDPAIATGPFITTFNDVIGLFIYLGLVTLALRFV